MKNKDRNIKNKTVIGISAAVILVLVCAVAFLVLNGKEKKEEPEKEEKNIEEQVEEPETPVQEQPEIPQKINFEELWAVNPDIYAYIEIPGTVISYPVLQSIDGSVDYLNTTAEGIAGLPGSIYTENMAARDFSDRNVIMYGHDMKDGSMFAGLHQFENQEFLQTNRDIYIYTPEKAWKYQIFAAVVFDDRYLPDSYDFKTQDGIQKYLDDIYNSTESANRYQPDMRATADDTLLTLSTCIGNRPNNRWVIIAKRAE